MFSPWRPWSDVSTSLDRLRTDALLRSNDVSLTVEAQNGWRDLAICYGWNMIQMRHRIEAERAIRRGLG
jgi:hypothetical protein